nr:glycosyltransferase family 4 protein [Antricoccus suffuscus]
MRKAGWEVHVVCSPGSQVDTVRKREGVAVHELPMRREIALLSDLRSLREWWRLLGRIRPSVTNLSTPKAALIGSIASLLRRVPRRVYLVRGLRLEGERGVRRAVLWAMERLTIAMSTDVLVVSASLRDELVAARLARPKHLTVIESGSSNGVQGREIARRVELLDTTGLRAGHGIPPDAFVVCYLGRLASDKGIHDLVDALLRPETETFHLLAVGEVENGAVVDYLRRLGPRLHLENPVTDVVPILAAADSLCLPTRREGFPNVVLEAGAAALPVVTTRATGARDSVIDGQTGFLVDVGDSLAMAARLNQIAADPHLRSNLGQAGRLRTLTDFVPEQIWTELEHRYHGT